MAGSDSAKPASTKRTEAPGDASSSSQSEAAAMKAKVDGETAAAAEQKESNPPPHNTSASAGPKASQAANADAKTEANDGPVDGGGAADEGSNPNSPSSKSSPSSASSSSTDPAFKDLDTRLNDVFLILKTALKVLDIAAQEKCTFAEAMPAVPGWFDACKVILLDALHTYGGERAEEGEGGRQVELLKRMAREATEIMAIIEREGRGKGESEGEGNNEEEEEEEEGEGEGVELAEWVE